MYLKKDQFIKERAIRMSQALINRIRLIIPSCNVKSPSNALRRVMDKDVLTDNVLSQLINDNPSIASFLDGAFEASPYLADLSARDPRRLARILTHDPEELINKLVDHAFSQSSQDEDVLMRELRLVKQEAALVIALADLGKAWNTKSVTIALTRIADATLKAAVRFVLREAALQGKIELADLRDPERGSGWIILGMGKQGAYELNYSSDIDLVIFFDRTRARLIDPSEAVDFFVKLTKRIVKIMSQSTTDGYVFRVDLRLRPDPGATPIAIPLEAALSYYESMGQNWERAAFIKARAVAGDNVAGENFLKELQPFIWRKYFDFAAIADVHSIKRQIHTHKGHGKIAVKGHNIKLGRGGIREIEFFVQTQQLILGGRDHRLRGRETLAMLDQLAENDWIEKQAKHELETSYLFLRDVEHRIQMIADEQKHTLPNDDEGIANIGRMMGFIDHTDFSTALLGHLNTVQRYYSKLFENKSQLSNATGNLVFTGDAYDPDTISTLSTMGFSSPKNVTDIIRSWHFGRYPATRSTVARERLTELTPALLMAFGQTENSDAALLAFDKLISHLPAGVQLFSLLASNPKLLELLSIILGSAPKLSQTISQRSRVVGALLEPDFFKTFPSAIELNHKITMKFNDCSSYETILDQARIFGQEQQFQIGVRVLTGSISVADAGEAYSRLAESLVKELFASVQREFARLHGQIDGARVAIVAMGKLGGNEMTAASDLDLMLIYDSASEAISIGGEKQLPASQYYARLTQRLITALSAPTAEGQLYETDFRLRPSGNKGPIAVSLKAFIDYHENESWTWEHMALTRARVITSSKGFSYNVEDEIKKILTCPRDYAKLTQDVLSMRRRIEKEKGSNNPWELKNIPGGLIDIEFIAQYFMLRYGAQYPDIFSTTTKISLINLNNMKLIDKKVFHQLVKNLELYQGLIQLLRLATDKVFSPTDSPRGLSQMLLKFGQASEPSELESMIIAAQKQTRNIFNSIFGAVIKE